MMLKETLGNIVKSQYADLANSDRGIEREKLAEIDSTLPFVTVISGIRRCGKSTLLCQLMRKTEKVYYFNFEDSRAIEFNVADFESLNAAFQEEYGEGGHYFFDEVQNVENWERIVRGLLDQKKHVTITGSNATLLSRELGTKLTGRHLRYELFPFSYREFLKFTSQAPNVISFEEYLKKGGFPDYVKSEKTEILQQLLSDVLTRDIAVRHGIRNVKTLRELTVYLLSNTGKEFSYNSLRKTFELGSVNSIVSFVSFLEDSYLLFTVSKFDYSMKKQLVNAKKIYSIDTGLSRVNSTSLTSDKGRMLENAVFLELRRNGSEVFYFKEKNECDFVTRKNGKINLAVQVCHTLSEENKDRELNGLIEAMDKFKMKTGLVLTLNQEDKIIQDGREIVIKPTWKWLTEPKATR